MGPGQPVLHFLHEQGVSDCNPSVHFSENPPAKALPPRFWVGMAEGSLKPKHLATATR